MTHTLTSDDIEELKALALFNDATSKPSAIGLMHMRGADGPNYQALADAGLVRIYSRPPKGWSRSRFFGARITSAGRAAISN